MRTGPFSQPMIISLLNRYFVPVYASNEDYNEGRKPSDEVAVVRNIMREAADKQFSVGSVHVYLLDQQGELYRSLHVRDAANPRTLAELLNNAIKALKPTPGDPLCEPKPQAQPPEIDQHDVLLHLTAREVTRRGEMRRETTDRSVEDWITLQPDEWKQFLPPDEIATGETWQITPHVAEKILTHFYPYTADWDNSRNQFHEKRIEARVLPRDASGAMVVAIQGWVKMLHARQPSHRDIRLVDAELVGYVRLDADARLPHFVMTTGSATYGDQPFSVVLESYAGPGSTVK